MLVGLVTIFILVLGICHRWLSV